MATMTLIVVIIVLVSNLAIIYLPFSKAKKACLSLVVLSVFTFCSILYSDWNNDVPCDIVRVAKNSPEAKKAMMARFNISEARMDRALHPELYNKANSKEYTPTQWCIGVVEFVLLIAAIIFTPVMVSCCRESSDDDAEKAYNLAWTYNVLACAFVLSLYYGLELVLLPWRKKMLEKGQLFSTLPKKELA